MCMGMNWIMMLVVSVVPLHLRIKTAILSNSVIIIPRIGEKRLV